MRTAPEKRFEKRVIAYYRKMGCVCEHLGGPEGWPDLCVFNVGLENNSSIFFELKSTKVKKWRDIRLGDIFEPSQVAFYKKYKDFYFYLLMETPDGIYKAYIPPVSYLSDLKIGELSLELLEVK